jgi:universal stress protein A
MTVIRNVLSAIDFSECSRRALETAVALAVQHEARLTLLHVVQAPFVSELGDDAWRTFAPASQQASKALLQWAERARQGGVRDVAHLEMTGTPWECITDKARELGSDLIVLGTHGRAGIDRLLLGSVAERVVRHAPCSVLVVRAAGKS